jgi:hypothetical protein
MAHVEHPESGCALPALGAEIARSDVTIREQAEHWICRLQESWAQVLESDSLAWAILSQCVGALVVARMLATTELQRKVLKSSHEEIGRQMASSEESDSKTDLFADDDHAAAGIPGRIETEWIVTRFFHGVPRLGDDLVSLWCARVGGAGVTLVPRGRQA